MESVVYLSVPLSLFVRGANMIILTGRRHRDCTYAGHININVKGGTRSDLGERSAKVRTLEVSCRRKGEMQYKFGSLR